MDLTIKMPFKSYQQVFRFPGLSLSKRSATMVGIMVDKHFKVTVIVAALDRHGSLQIQSNDSPILFISKLTPVSLRD